MGWYLRGGVFGLDLIHPEKPIVQSARIKAPIRAVIPFDDEILISCVGDESIWHLNQNDFTFYQTATDSLYNGINILSVQQPSSHELLFACKDLGIISYGESEPLLKYTTPNDFIRSFIALSKDTLLYATENSGTFSYHKEGKNAFSKRMNQENAFPSASACTCFYKDRSDRLWMGTTNMGVFYSNPSSDFFQFESLGNLTNKTSCINSVLSLYPMNDDKLVIGLDHKGVQIYDSKTASLTLHPITQRYPDLTEGSINSVLVDSRGFTWAATYMNSLKVDGPLPETQVINNLIAENMPANCSVKYVYEDSKQRVWIAASNQPIFCYNSATKEMIRYAYTNTDSFCLVEDQNHTIWLGTYVGLFRFNEQTATFERNFLPDKTNEYGYTNRIVSICEANHSLWLCSHNGLIEYHPDSKEYTIYTTNEGLSSNQTKAALYDEEGERLWVSTDKGLNAVNLKTKKILSYGLDDNIIYKEFNHASSMKDSKGIFYFGCVNGYYHFNPKLIKENTESPQVVLTNLRIPDNLYNNEITKKENSHLIPIGNKKEIEIPFSNPIFTLQYVAPSYENNQKTEYACRLINFSDSWTYMGKERSVTFTTLRPGTYLFQVKASNGNGFWSNNYTSLKVVILPPWYLTIWALLAYLLLVICIIIFFMRLYANRIKMKSQLANEQFERQHIEKQNDMKMSFFSNVTHELRTPLTLILSPINNLLNKTVSIKDRREYLLIIQRNALILLELVNELLDFSKSEAGNIVFNPQQANLVEIIEQQINIFLPLATDKRIEVTFNTQLKTLWCVADKSIIKKIVSNLLSNALKYTPDDGSVSVDLQLAGDGDKRMIQLSVKDTGRGIAEHDQKFIFNRFYQIKDNDSYGTGIGLALVKNLASIHNGTISLQSDLGKGSVFTLKIPYVEAEQLNEAEMPQESEGSTVYYTDVYPNDVCSKEKAHKVLIAEDNKDLLFYLSHLLGTQYTVITAENGKVGLEKAQQEMPDVILSDVLMPEIDGKEFCKQIKQNVNTCHIPFLLLTALISKEAEKEGLTVGADDYITKPFDAEILLTKISNLIKSRMLISRREKTLKALKPIESKIIDKDSQFLLNLIELIKANLGKADLKIDDLSREMGISHTPFYNKIKKLTNQTPNEFLKHIRLEQAKNLLSEGKLTISEIAYQTGFNSPKYFRNCFKEQFGMTPSEFQENNH